MSNRGNHGTMGTTSNHGTMGTTSNHGTMGTTSNHSNGNHSNHGTMVEPQVHCKKLMYIYSKSYCRNTVFLTVVE